MYIVRTCGKAIIVMALQAIKISIPMLVYLNITCTLWPMIALCLHVH